jgi:hypothetical protein
LPDSPVREACQADKPAGNLAQVGPVLVLAADLAAVVDPAAGLVVVVAVVVAAVRVLAVDPVEVAAAVAVAEAVFH